MENQLFNANTQTNPPPVNNSNNTPEGVEGNNIFKKVLKIILPIAVIIVIIIFIVYFVFPFFNRGSSGAGKGEVVYWGLFEPEEVMKTVIDDFEKENPDIKVKYELKDLKGYRETLVTRINNGSGPDVFRFHNSWTGSIRSNLTALPESIVTKEELDTVYFPVVKSDVVVNNAAMGVPLHMDSLSMFVNTEIFDEAGIPVPKTWDDFIQAAVNLTVKDEEDNILTSGSSIGTYDNILHSPDLISLMMAQNGVDLKKPQDFTDKNTEALRFYTNFATGKDNLDIIWDNNKANSLNEFMQGNVAMYFGYSWDVFQIKSANPDMKFAVYPVPYLSKPLTISSYWVEGVSSKSKNQKAALTFLKYLSRPETQQKLYSEESKLRGFGELPARRDLAEKLSDNKLIYPFVSQAENSVSTYFSGETYDTAVNDELNQYLQNAINSILSGTSVQSASETLTEGINQVLGKYGLK